MYWLLLPLDANARRHLADETEPSNDFWTRLLHRVWERIVHPRTTVRR